MNLKIALLLGLVAVGRPVRAALFDLSPPDPLEDAPAEAAAAAAGGVISVRGNSAKVREWCAQRGRKCCGGIDSCLFVGKATVSANACNGDRACGSDFTTPLGVIGRRSCNAADSCAGTVAKVKSNSCNAVRSCAGAGGTIGPRACNGEDGCANSSAKIKTNSCNGANACSGASGTIGPRACNGEGGCTDFEGTALVNSCNGVDSCDGVGPSATIETRACDGPRGCDGADTFIGFNSCRAESACSNAVNVNTPIPPHKCNSGTDDCDTVGYVQLPDTRPPVCLNVTTDILSWEGEASDNRPREFRNTDNGIWTVALLAGSENLVLEVNSSFIIGDGTVSFSALRLDDALPSYGTVEVTDRAGNACTLPIALEPLEPLDSTPPVCTELEGEELVTNFNGGAEDADTGIASVTLAAGASNLNLTVPPFDVGNRTITFTAARLNDTQPAAGTVVVEDRVGLNCTLGVALDPFDADIFDEETGFPTALHEDLFGVPSALAVPIYITQDVLPEASGIYPAVNEDGTSFFVQVASVTIPSADLDSEIPDDASQELLDFLASNDISTFAFRGFLIFETRSVEVEALAYTLSGVEPAGNSSVLVFENPTSFAGLDDDDLDTDFDFPPTFPPSPLERRLGADYDGSYGVVPYKPHGRNLQGESCGNALQEAIENLNCQAPEQTYVNRPCVAAAEFAFNRAVELARGDYDAAIAAAKVALELRKAAIAIERAIALRKELLACVLVGFLAGPLTGALCAARAIAIVALKTAGLTLASNLLWEAAKRNAEEALRLALAAACQTFRFALFACVRCVECGDPNLTPCGDACYDPATQKCCPDEAIVGKDDCCPGEKKCPDDSCIPQDSCCPEDKPCNDGCIPKKDCCEPARSRALRGFKEDVLSGRRLAGDPCCDDPDDPCCGSDDPCCGSDDPCCGSDDPCCGSDDPCCGSNDSCCGKPDCGGSSGDPHMTTFDGLRFDCQGRGEFVLVTANETVVQARFKKRGRVAVTSGVATTEGPGSTKVEVSVPVDGSSPNLVVNGAVISPPSRGYEDGSVIVVSTSGSDAGPFRITYKASTLSVFARYSSSFSGYLNLNVGLPQVLRDVGTVGLLGSADNDPTNDWMTPNGTVLEIPPSRTGRIGLPSLEYCLDNWCIDDEASTLFTYYEEGFNFTYFSGCNDLDREVVDISTAPPEATAFCGIDEACLVDFIEGGQVVAKETLVETAELDAVFTTGSLVANPASLTAGTSVNVALSIDTSGSGLTIDEFVLFRVDSVTGEQQGEGAALTLTDGNNNGVFDGSINIFSSEAGESFGFRAIPVIAGEQDPDSPAAILRLVTVRSYANETGIVDDNDDPGCTGPCDDGNPCTIDFCLNSVCRTDPVACDIGKRCDPFSGRCQDVENLVPCIAVIDEWNNRDYTSEWETFRESYPQRPFCLLVPNGSLQRLPNGFADDTVNNPDGLDRTIASTVNRDNGNNATRSDWQTICGLDALTSENVQFVGLFVDDSGSMRVDTVRASLNKFEADMAAKGIEIRRVVNGVERWIDPFLTDLVPV